jgi:hypothetical protein
MNPNSRRYPTRLRRQGAPFANARALKIAILSLPLLLVTVAQAPAAPRPTPHEAAQPANAHDFLGWLRRQLAPAQRRQSRALSSPPMPRPRPVELMPTPIGPSPTSEELAPASLEQREASPPMPRPRPAELTPTPTGPSPTSEELAPAPLEPRQMPTDAASPEGPNEGPLND